MLVTMVVAPCRMPVMLPPIAALTIESAPVTQFMMSWMQAAASPKFSVYDFWRSKRENWFAFAAASTHRRTIARIAAFIFRDIFFNYTLKAI